MHSLVLQPIRILSKADIAQAMQWQAARMEFRDIARELKVSPALLESSLFRARAFGFAAWDPNFMYHIAQAV